MNKNVLIGIIVVVVIIGALVIIGSRKNSSTLYPAQTQVETSTNPSSPSSDVGTADSLDAELNSMDQAMPADSELGPADPTQ